MTESRPTVLTGGCQCGAIRYALYAPPEEASLCHCRMCQKATGNLFIPLARVSLANFAWTHGAPTVFASSSIAERGFCAACGTPLSFRYVESSSISVTIGSLDRPEAVKPSMHYGVESRIPWLRTADDWPESRTEDDLAAGLLTAFVNHQNPD